MIKDWFVRRTCALGAVLAMGAAAGQVSVPTSHSGSLSLPTSSLLLGAEKATIQGWWATPVNAIQTTWKNNINGYANQVLDTTEPIDFADAAATSKTLQAKAFRYAMDPVANAADLPNIVAALKTAKISATFLGFPTWGSAITRPEIAMNYFQAYDFVRDAAISSADRTTIESRLAGTNVLSMITAPTQSNNQRAKYAATKGFAGLLLGRVGDLDTGLSSLNQSYRTNTTEDGWYADSQNYLNYTLAQVGPFLRAYKNAPTSPVDLYPNLTPFVTMYLGQRLGNGLTPSLQNGYNCPVALSHFSWGLSDPALRAAVIWNTTQLSSFDWTSWTNSLNNDNTYVDYFTLTDFGTAPAAPITSPTYFSGGEAGVTTFRNTWAKAGSHYLGLSAGISAGTGYQHYSTGDLVVGANGYEILVPGGYQRSAGDELPNQPAGSDLKQAAEHNVLLARNTGTGTWGIGADGDNQYNGLYGSNSSTQTARLDSGERGGFKGVGDFSTLNLTYSGGGAGSGASVRRSVAYPNEDYFAVADVMARTDATNKDFAVNLLGKGTLTVLTDTPTYQALRWQNTQYGPYNGGATLTGPPYTDTVSSQVILHVVSTHALSLATDTTSYWLHENYNRYYQLKNARPTITNVSSGGFLTIIEPGAAGDASRLTVTSLSTTTCAAARVENTSAGWTDWILSQPSAGSVTIDGGALSSDALYAYLRKRGTVVDSVMLSGGTTVGTGGQPLLAWSNAVTASVLFATGVDGEIRGTLSADGLAADTVLTVYGLSLYPWFTITSAQLDGAPVAFANSLGTGAVTMPGSGGGAFVIVFSTLAVPEPGLPALLLLATTLGATRRRRRR